MRLLRVTVHLIGLLGVKNRLEEPVDDEIYAYRFSSVSLTEGFVLQCVQGDPFTSSVMVYEAVSEQ